MIEFLKFAFFDLPHFVGVILLMVCAALCLEVVFYAIAKIFK